MFEVEWLMDEGVWAHNFTDNEIRRGRQYCQKGYVSNLFVADDAQRITSIVKGSKRHAYRVSIEIIKENGFDRVEVGGYCSCYVGYNCKHVVASIFEAKEQRASATLSLAYTIPAKNKAALASRQLNQWVDEFQSALTNDALPQPVTRENYHLLYVLKSRPYQKRKLEVELKLSRVLKAGGYGKPKKYSATANTQQAHLQVIDEEIIMGLQLLNKRSFQFSSSGSVIHLEGSQASKWLEMILKTGRCFWESAPENSLAQGKAKALEFSWEILPNACQALKLSIDDKSADILILDKIWYIDKTEGLCGVAETEVPVNAAIKLLDVPEVPPEMTQEISRKIKSAIPNAKQLLPKKLNDPIVENNVAFIPEMRLSIESVRMPDKDAYFVYNEPQFVDVPIAEVYFDYEGRVVPFSFEGTQEVITYIEDGVVCAVKRDFEKEEACLQGLSKCMQLAVLDKAPGADKPVKLAIRSIQHEDDFLQFSMHVLPQLEHNGWRIVREHDAFLSVVHEDEVSWYSELEEESGYDYFGFKMGIIIDDEKINMLPVIAQIIKSTSVEHFKNFSDDQVISLTLPGGKILSVPYARIKPILNILVELYNTELGEGDALRLSTRQAALLVEIEKAFGATQLRWFGGEKLRRLGKSLSDFKSIKRARTPKTFKATLRAYQQDGVDWLQFLREYQLGGILADDMGLGKTVQMLAHLSIEKSKRRMKKPSLIVAPTSLMVNWRLEAERFAPNLKVLVYHGDDRHVHRDTHSEYDLVLTTYPLLVRDKEMLLSNEYYYLILDEAQFIKNHKAKSTQIVQQLKAECRLCMTGTPMENHLGELWSLFHFLMPGLLGDATQFKRLFRTPIEKHNDGDRRKSLALRIKPFMLRRQKSEVLKELPEKTEIIRCVELQGPERDLYESIRLSMEKKVRSAIQENGLARSHIIILDALLKLRQTCCHSKLLKLASAKKAHKHSSKMTLLTEMLPKLVEEGRKILLFSQFTTMLQIIEEMLNKKGLAYVKLTGSTKNRAKPIESFQAGDVPIFLISLKAGGTGLNLTAADTVIHYDPWWNPAAEDQATDRAHRIGQKKSVFVYKLLASGTVEETIQEMQQKKRQLMDGLFSEQSQGKAKLSSDDLSSLFKPLSDVAD